MEAKMKQDLAEQFARLSASWHDDGFSDGLRGVMTELHPDNPYLGIYKAGYEAGMCRKRLNDAAPELLEALKAMVAIWEGPRELAALRFAKSVIDARAAIAKATGE